MEEHSTIHVYESLCIAGIYNILLLPIGSLLQADIVLTPYFFYVMFIQVIDII